MFKQDRGLDLSSIYDIDIERTQKDTQKKMDKIQQFFPQYINLDDDDNDNDNNNAKDSLYFSNDDKDSKVVHSFYHEKNYQSVSFEDIDIRKKKLQGENFYTRLKEAFKYSIKQQKQSHLQNYSQGFRYYCNRENNNIIDSSASNTTNQIIQKACIQQNAHLIKKQRYCETGKQKFNVQLFNDQHQMINREDESMIMSAFQRIQSQSYNIKSNLQTEDKLGKMFTQKFSHYVEKFAKRKYSCQNEKDINRKKIKIKQQNFRESQKRQSRQDAFIQIQEETIRDNSLNNNRQINRIQIFDCSKVAEYRYRFPKLNQQIISLANDLHGYKRGYEDKRALVLSKPQLMHHQLSQFQNLKKKEFKKRRFINILQ